MDAVHQILPDESSEAFKAWNAHANTLSDAYQLIMKEDKNIPWPEVRQIFPVYN
jgi:hypothetical protein